MNTPQDQNPTGLLAATFSRWPIGIKLAVSAMGVMVIVLGASVGAVSTQIWTKANEQGDRSLGDLARSTSDLPQRLRRDGPQGGAQGHPPLQA